MSMPDLSVVVVTWNVRDLTLECLQSVMAAPGLGDVQVVVVDNASSDGTVEAVQTLFPDAQVIASDRNLGFPVANNLGIAQATGRHVLLLNPDTVVGPDALAACVAALDADPALGAVGCRLTFADGRTQYECGRRAYRLIHLAWEALYLQVLFPRSPVFAHQLMGDWDHKDDRDVEALSGAFMMLRREALNGVGGVPTELFMYHEDLALCLRLRKAGWRLRCVGQVSTIHHGGASSSRSPSAFELLEGEVRVRLIRERSGVFWGLLARLLFGVRQIVRLGVALVVQLPGGGRIRRRYPTVASVGKQARLLAWTVAPRFVLADLPGGGAEV